MTAESFHSRFRDEFLNREVFAGLLEAQVKVEGWRVWYNGERPHSRLKYKTPDEFAAETAEKQAEINYPTGT